MYDPEEVYDHSARLAQAAQALEAALSEALERLKRPPGQPLNSTPGSNRVAMKFREQIALIATHKVHEAWLQAVKEFADISHEQLLKP